MRMPSLTRYQPQHGGEIREALEMAKARIIGLLEAFTNDDSDWRLKQCVTLNVGVD